MPRSGEVVIPFVKEKRSAAQVENPLERAAAVSPTARVSSRATGVELRTPFHTKGQIIPLPDIDINNKGRHMTATFESTISDEGLGIRADDPPAPDEQPDDK